MGQLFNTIYNDSNIKITKDNFIKDKVVVLLWNKNSWKEYFISRFIRGTIFEQFEQQKKIILIKKKNNRFNYYFVCTPDFSGDAKKDEKIINELLDEIKSLPRINVIILYKRQFYDELSESMIKALKAFMNLYPSKTFFEHVILLKIYSKESVPAMVYYHQNHVEFKIFESKKELNDLMLIHNIDKPSRINAYLFNIEKEEYGDDIIDFFDIFNQIINTYPIYQEIKEQIIIKIEEEKEDDYTFINEIKNLHLTITDINDEQKEIIQELLNKKYNLDELKHKYLIEILKTVNYDFDKEKQELIWKADLALIEKIKQEKYYNII